MNSDNYFISCDWGTSNFRLRLIEKSTLRLVDSVQTNEGIKQLNQRFLEVGNGHRKAYFSAYLLEQAAKLADVSSLPKIVISGMASSNIGLAELPYGTTPFGEGLNGISYQDIVLDDSSSALLISGIRNERGVMRGEETQALGLLGNLTKGQEAIVILPGTHSKHLEYSNGVYEGFRSFMTGELFQILSEKSILANNVEKCTWTVGRKRAFMEGIEVGYVSGLTNNIFSVRAKQLFGDMEKKDNYFYLSGLLIGDELSYLEKAPVNIVLAATEPFYSLYELALISFMDTARIRLLNEKELEKALILGQYKILDHYGKQ